MRLSLGVPAFAALAAALPAPQEIDIDLLLAAPEATVTQAIGVTAQVVTYDATSLAAQATSVAPSATIETPDALSTTAVEKRDDACAPQLTGVTTSGYAVTATDNPSAFVANPAFAAAATNAPTPSGYTNTFQNLNASNSAYGFLGFVSLDDYDTSECAAKCDAINGCMSFNLYFERDSSQTGCDDPPSVTLIKCALWGGPVSASNANFYGGVVDDFQVVVAGSNGYVNQSIEVPSGFTFTADLGSATINAPYDASGYDTFMGSRVFTNGPFNASLCAAFCTSQTAYNIKHPATDGTPPKICNFFTTYLLYLNTTADYKGQYCSLYTEAWDSSYATGTGYWYGKDHYMIDHSYSFTNASGSGVDSKTGDVVAAAYQAALDMKYYTSSLTSTFLPFCTSLLGYTIPTITTTVVSTPVLTKVASVTATVTVSASQAPQKRAAGSTPGVLTKYPAAVISAACSVIATKPASSLTSVVTQSVTLSTSTTFTTTTVATATATSTPALFILKSSGDSSLYVTVDSVGAIRLTKDTSVAVPFYVDDSGQLHNWRNASKVLVDYYEPNPSTADNKIYNDAPSSSNFPLVCNNYGRKNGDYWGSCHATGPPNGNPVVYGFGTCPNSGYYVYMIPNSSNVRCYNGGYSFLGFWLVSYTGS